MSEAGGPVSDIASELNWNGCCAVQGVPNVRTNMTSEGGGTYR
jgi:hypothetical protein